MTRPLRKLHASGTAGGNRISGWWSDVQNAWHDNVAGARETIGERRAERDVAKAQRRAEDAEGDALFAIDFAYSAIQEAEYATLDAQLARMEADELAVDSAPTA